MKIYVGVLINLYVSYKYDINQSTLNCRRKKNVSIYELFISEIWLNVK